MVFFFKARKYFVIFVKSYDFIHMNLNSREECMQRKETYIPNWVVKLSIEASVFANFN